LRGGDRLAGSSLRMDRAVANAVRIAGLSLEQAVAMASVNPGRLCGIEPRGTVRFTFEAGQLLVLETVLDGETVYRA
jgi:N-acetylglucosamine-6-phosphate deacetylase